MLEQGCTRNRGATKPFFSNGIADILHKYRNNKIKLKNNLKIIKGFDT